MTGNQDNKLIVNNIVNGIQELKGKKIVVIDLTKLQDAPCSYFVICQGDSNVHVNAIAQSVKTWVRDHIKVKPIAMDGMENSEWIAMDYGQVIVHIFQRPAREFYDLENLWLNAELSYIEDD